MQMMHVGHGAAPARFRDVTVRERVVTSGASCSRSAATSLAAAGEAEAEIYLRVAERGCARFAIGELGPAHGALGAAGRRPRGARTRASRRRVTSRLDRDALVEAVQRRGAGRARCVPEVEGFPGFARARTSPPARARRASRRPRRARRPRSASSASRPCWRAVRDAGLVSAGMLETTRASHAVATTRGCARVARRDRRALPRVGARDAGRGRRRGLRRAACTATCGALRLDEETERAIRVCKRVARPGVARRRARTTSSWSPRPSTELLEWLAAIAFGAPEVEQGTSPLAGRLGERITGEGVDLVEDPLDDPALGFGVPFDREGTWRRRVPLVEKGVARARPLRSHLRRARGRDVDRQRARCPSLGSAGGVGATALTLGGGAAASVDELIAGIDRGLYVCRLHYVNGLLEPRRAVMTGLTRDGCFLVEKGKIARAVGNMRFTDSLLEGLARCDGMTRERKAVPTWWSDAGAFVAPAVRHARLPLQRPEPGAPEARLRRDPLVEALP